MKNDFRNNLFKVIPLIINKVSNIILPNMSSAKTHSNNPPLNSPEPLSGKLKSICTKKIIERVTQIK